MAILVVAAASILVVPDKPVTACGPDFPTNMLVRRADALATMWDGSFVEEAGKLVPVSAGDRIAFTRAPVQTPASAREQVLYDAAAESFHAGDNAVAARDFRALLRLPAKERRRFSVAAAYSLGRSLYAEWKDQAAIAAFRQVRELVRAGYGDEKNVAADSLGEEARIERERRGNLVASVRLYAQQAALGGAGSEASLLFVVRGATPAERAALYRDDVGTKLLALYFYTRGSELEDADRAAWGKELAKHVTTEARGAAYLAAAAYRSGEWSAAAALSKLCTHAPIATWVQAKLALRDGDRARADALLRDVEASRLAGNAFDSDLPRYSLDEDPRSIVRGELGLIALADQRFAEAADWFARGTRHIEAAYVAERVMTTDELLAAVQKSRDARLAAPPKATDDEDPCSAWEPSFDEHPYCWGKSLLDIYARRLIRQHRDIEALDAFAGSDHAETAQEYSEQMSRAEATAGIERAEHFYRASRIMRRSGMEIAGTEVGPDWRVYDGDYEREMLCMPSPTAGYAQIADAEYEESYHDPSEGCSRPTKGDVAFVSPLEASRVAASAPEFDQRFSYRYAASKLAESAANLLPPRTQAHAQMLCFAALYARRDRTRVDALYQRYLREGARLDGEFGESCDEPDFRAARSFDSDQQQRHVERAIAVAHANDWTWSRIRGAAWRHKKWLALPAIAFLMLLLLRRRHGASLGAL